MEPLTETGQASRRASLFTPEDVRRIAGRRGWLPAGEPDAEAATRTQWMTEAAQLLGAQAADSEALEALLERVFQYDAREALARPENQAVMAREGARQVLRELAALVLDSADVNSDRYKEIVTALKERTGRRGQELFHPVRLALAGRAGEGEFDRVILLLDGAARLEWSVRVKNCRERILEFCGALD
jgi:glutamyl/glutaminyl-tRNA synthetase